MPHPGVFVPTHPPLKVSLAPNIVPDLSGQAGRPPRRGRGSLRTPRDDGSIAKLLSERYLGRDIAAKPDFSSFGMPEDGQNVSCN